MYNTILVPLDGSERAEKILPHVESLAQNHGSRVVLLQIVELRLSTLPGAMNPLPTVEEYEEHTKVAEAYLANLQEGLQQKGIETSVEVAHGSVVETIIEVARRENADLIAMASHGRTGLGRVFYGSVAAGLLHRVSRPLLVIRSLDDE